MRHNPAYGIMGEFMESCAVPVDRLVIGLQRRRLHEVVDDVVEGAFAADTEVRAGRGNQRLRLRLDQTWSGRRRNGHDLFRQAIALVGVEDGEAFEERDCAGHLARFLGAPSLALRCKPVRVDDCGAMFAFADVAAETEGLAERKPALTGEAALDNRSPQDQHIDPRVAPGCGGVLRHGERRLRHIRSPRLNPGDTAGLKFGDDLVGDFLVEAGAVGRRGCACRILRGETSHGETP